MQTYNLKRAPTTTTITAKAANSCVAVPTPQPRQIGMSANAASPPDFDFQLEECRFFKSSFARSLSLNSNTNNNNNNTSSANVPALSLPPKRSSEKPAQIEHNPLLAAANENMELTCSSPPPPALPARRHIMSNNNNNNNCNLEQNLTHFHKNAGSAANQLATSQQQATQLHRNLANVMWPLQDANGGGNGNMNYNNSNNNSTQQPSANIAAAATTNHEQTLNVEAVILQNQVDTLQWQLKQTETNCEMYRAVMEEVARFFERYQLQQQQLRQQQQQQQQQLLASRNTLCPGAGSEQIARSKSLHHVVGGLAAAECNAAGGSLNEPSATATYLRARSSTNLHNKSLLTMQEQQQFDSIAPAGSYNAFKDFTWRRSPKKLGGVKSRLSALELAEDKLNQEAFRLARTIRNLLHTSQQQPDLTQPRHSLSSLSSLAMGSVGRLCKASNSSMLTALLPPPLLNSTSIMAAAELQPAAAEAAAAGGKDNAAELLFLRANNMRDSRLSLRSSTDSSAHSTISSSASSSSKLETDEETVSVPAANAGASAANHANGSSTEDESGFSSISSFHDIGVPLCSTLIGSGNCRLSLSHSESRNSTLKPTALAATHPNNVLGLPHHSPTASSSSSVCSSQSQTPSMQAAAQSKTYRNANRYQRFSTLSNEDATAVLWV